MPHSKVNLVLVSARKSRGSDDYDVRRGDKSGPVIGRIMRLPQAPEGRPWFWAITAREQPSSVYNRGYAASREQAMRYLRRSTLALQPRGVLWTKRTTERNLTA